MNLASQPWFGDARTQRLLKAFADGSAELRFVGGCVRDAVLGRAVHDIDCATPALPEVVMQLLERAHIKCVPTGIAHGTVTAVIDSKPYEITTLRRDTHCDGRHAEVAFTTAWEEDAQRRDFTMNALYCDAHGMVHDHTDGLADAQAQRVRFIGDPHARISEDALRILRFFRFSATHGTATLDAEALRACTQHRAMLRHLSGERVQQEMFKLLSAPDPLPALGAMQKSGVLSAVLPVNRVSFASLHCLQFLASTAPSLALLRLSLLLRATMGLRLLQRIFPFCDVASFYYARLALRAQLTAECWKLSKRDRAALVTLSAQPGIGTPRTDTAWLQLLRYRHDADMAHALILREWAECGSMPADAHAVLTAASQTARPVFPLTGKDLIARGLEPGPAVSKSLALLEDEWLHDGFQGERETWLNYFDEIHQRGAGYRPW